MSQISRLLYPTRERLIRDILKPPRLLRIIILLQFVPQIHLVEIDLLLILLQILLRLNHILYILVTLNYLLLSSQYLRRDLLDFLVIHRQILLDFEILLVVLFMQIELLFEFFGVLRILLSHLPHLQQRLRKLGGVENLIKNLLEVALVAEGPQRLVLVAKDHILKNGVADTHEHRDLPIHLGAVFVNRYLIPSFIPRLQHLLQLLKFLLIFLIHQLKASHGEYGLALDSIKLQLDARLGLRQITDPRIVNECLSCQSVRRHGTAGHRAQSLDYCGLAGAVLAEDEG